MKSKLAFLSLAGLVLFAALFVLVCVFPANGRGDFELRMNELACLRQGVDPFAVWHEDVVFPPYRSNIPKTEIKPGCTEQVNAYVPWAYTLMLPLSFLARPVAWTVYCVLMGVAILLLFRIARRWGGEDDNRNALFQAAFPLLVVSYLLWSNAAIGNVIVFVLMASVLMAWCLVRGYDALAGLCWTVAMVKPQSAILFAIPLLLRGRWKACAVAAGTCVVATFLPMHMCGSTFVDLLKAGPAANAELFLGCGTWPRFLLGSAEYEIGIALGIGALLCLAMTFCLRRERDWMTLLMPAAICGASWTYTQAYSHAMGWFLAFVLVRELVRNPRSRFLWTMLGLSAFFLSRWFLAWHGLCNFAGWRFPMSDYAYDCLNSLNSTASLALAAVFCAWKSRQSAGRGVI